MATITKERIKISLWYAVALLMLTMLLTESMFYGIGPAPLAAKSVAITSAILIIAYLLFPLLWSEGRPTPRNIILGSTLTTLATALSLFISTPIESWQQLTLPLTIGVLAITFMLGALTLFLNRLIKLSATVAQRLVVGMLLLTATVPLWLSPLASQIDSKIMTNAIVAVSPVNYLAALIDYDLLRSGWFYENSAWGGLRYDYPSPVLMTLVYAGLAALFYLSVTIRQHRTTNNNSISASFHPNNI